MHQDICIVIMSMLSINEKHRYAVVCSSVVQHSLTKLSSMAVNFVWLMLVYTSDAASI